MKLLNIIKSKNAEEKVVSLSGLRTLLVYRILLEGPKTLDEIRDILSKIEFLHEDLSDDTLRTCINNLREAGCQITKATKLNDYKYNLISNPLEFNISDDEIYALKNVFQRILDSNSLTDLEKFEKFIYKLINFIADKETKDKLNGLILIGKINPVIYKQMYNFCLKKSMVTMRYLTAGSEFSKEIKLICNKMFIRSGKIYFEGYSLVNKKYQFLLLERVESVISEKKFEIQNQQEDCCAVCEIYDINFKPQENETVINTYEKHFTVKFIEKNSFILRQKILSYGNLCKVIYPYELQNRISNILEEMIKIYDN